MAVRALLLLLLLVVAAVSGGPRGLAGLGDDDYGPPESDNDFGAGQDGGAAVCPHRCVCRFDASPKHVDCSGKKLKEFPLFEEIPEDVEFLDLSDNEIRSVPRDLPEWPRLERLSLAGNLLEDFPPRTLASLSALEELDLSRNIIPSLRHIKPDRFIVNNHLLQVLNLSGNGLQDLGHGSFQSLSSQSLAVLDVSNCSVSSIDGQEALAELPALHTLRVNINPLQSLPPLRAPALRVLDLSDCRLRAVTERALAALPGLKQLAVNRNPDLGHILPPVPTTPDPDQLGQLANGTSMWLSSLDTLEAEDCSLHDTAFLEAMPKLTVLRLRGNRISTLEPLGLLGNGALVQLDLADNKIEELPPQALKGTELLKELDLSGNRLTAIHSETFVQHNSLRRLNVSRNPLASLQLNALGLRVLDASGAQLQVLPSGMLDGTPQLRHMNLSNNPLPALPDRIASPGLNAELQFLDLSHCRLTDISTTALNGLPELQALDLIGNRLTEPLKVDAFKENVALNLIQLDDNPWRCDCRGKDYQAFVDFLQAHPAKEDVHALTCFSPEAAQGKTWYDACLGPNAGSLASLDRWMFIAILAVSVALVGGGVFLARRYTRSKALRRRQRRQEQDDERRACEQEAAQRRLHRRMQLQQQEELRRQNVRAQTVSAEDPDPHPPSYEEVVLMDRMTAEQNDHASGSDSDSEDGDSDRFKLELQRKMVLMSSAGRGTDVIEEEEEEGTVASTRAGNQSNGSARKFDTRL